MFNTAGGGLTDESVMVKRSGLILKMLAVIALLSTVSQAQPPDALLFTAEEISYLKQKQQLRYCVDPNWLPFEALDHQQKHIGMSADYLKLLGQLLPLTMQLVPTKDWSESLLLLQQQRCDFSPLVMRTPSREKL
jgi:ABC-type amino acid transport substrate-binding protein